MPMERGTMLGSTTVMLACAYHAQSPDMINLYTFTSGFMFMQGRLTDGVFESNLIDFYSHLALSNMITAAFLYMYDYINPANAMFYGMSLGLVVKHHLLTDDFLEDLQGLIQASQGTFDRFVADTSATLQDIAYGISYVGESLYNVTNRVTNGLSNMTQSFWHSNDQTDPDYTEHQNDNSGNELNGSANDSGEEPEYNEANHSGLRARRPQPE